MPASTGEIRPSGATAVAPVRTSPAPPAARLPRGTRCQSDGKPSTLEYWHIGETKTLFRKVTSRSDSGENSWLIGEVLQDQDRPDCPAGQEGRHLEKVPVHRLARVDPVPDAVPFGL